MEVRIIVETLVDLLLTDAAFGLGNFIKKVQETLLLLVNEQLPRPYQIREWHPT